MELISTIAIIIAIYSLFKVNQVVKILRGVILLVGMVNCYQNKDEKGFNEISDKLNKEFPDFEDYLKNKTK